MRYLVRQAVTISALGLCVACGGGATGIGATLGVAAPQFDPTKGTLTAQGEVVARETDRVIRLNGRSRITESSDGAHFAAIVRDGDTYGASFGRNTSTGPTAGITYGTSTAPTLPVIGSARLTGDYAAVTTLQRDGVAHRVSSLITGDVTLNANFSDNTISGNLSNRKVFNTNGLSFTGVTTNLVTLRPTTIQPNGSFSGQPIGGQFNQSGSAVSAVNQSYSGQFADDGATVVGAFQMDHRYQNTNGFTDYRERGVFLAHD